MSTEPSGLINTGGSVSDFMEAIVLLDAELK
jgi:hypothetical protein